MRALFGVGILTVAFAVATPGLSVPAGAAQDKALVDRGIKVYQTQKCAMCHAIDGKGNQKGALDGVGDKLSQEEIRQWMLSPDVMAQKTKSARKPAMPNYTKLSKDDLNAVVAYMESLKKPKQ